MNIYAGNLNYKLQETELKEAFAQFGEVTNVKIIKDKVTGRAKGYGFVEMSNDDQALQAIERLNGTELKGRMLNVKKANPPKQDGQPE